MGSYPLSYKPNPLAALFVSALTFVVGGIPSIIFHVWIAFNLRVPYLWDMYNLPVRFFGSATPTFSQALAVNFFLVFMFGLTHTLTAQGPFKRFTERMFPPQYTRPIYMLITGLQLSAMMIFWQSTGTIAWQLSTSDPVMDAVVAVVIFNICMIPSQIALSQHGLFNFVGMTHPFKSIEQMKREESRPAKLITRGIYDVVRHPIYFSTLSATFVAHIMTYDRLMLGALMAVYLYIGVIYEERKLVKIFGPAYLRYRRNVSAILPFRFLIRGIVGSPEEKLVPE